MPRAPRPRRTWLERIFLFFGVCVAVGAAASTLTLRWYDQQLADIPRIDGFGSSLTAAESTPGEAKNYLLVGIDSAEGLDPDDVILNERPATLLTDTMMILRLDPEAADARLLSVPRDLYLPLSGLGYSERVNAARAIGGPDTLVDTLVDGLQIPIHHYIEVDFVGFLEVVDELGGVELCFDEAPLRDRQTGFEIPEPGCYLLDSRQSLAFVRARSMEQFIDDEWVSIDSTAPDLARIARQQSFILASLDRAAAQGIRNPRKLSSLIEATDGSLAIDDILTREEILQLGSDFAEFRGDSLQTDTLPNQPETIDGKAVLVLRPTAASEILDAFRGIAPGETVPQGTQVRVLNGTGESGLAATAGEDLAGAGFQVVEVGDAPNFDNPITTVRYVAADRAAAELVASYLVAGAVLNEVEQVPQADVVVVVGADYAGVDSPDG